MSFTSLVANQRKFFRTGDTKCLEFRKKQLVALKQMLVENREDLTNAVWKDLRRRPEVTDALEIGASTREIDLFLKMLDQWSQSTPVSKPNEYDTPSIEKDPLGVVLVIATWNYPINMVFLPLVAALAAGNTVVLKTADMSANCAQLFEKLIEKYFDPKVVTAVGGGRNETTEVLKERFDHIMYTGSPPVAKIVMTAAAQHLTPVTLELGGKCPVVVESDANIDLAAKRIAWGKWLNCGQTCLAPDYIMTTSEVKPKLIEAFRKHVLNFYGENPQSSKDYSRVINARHYDRLTKLLSTTKGKTLIGGGKPDRDDLYIPPTILDVEKSDVFLEEEIFGPVLPVITVSSFSEALDYIQDNEKPLAAYLFTEDKDKVKRFLKETSSGGVSINDIMAHVGVPFLPFGGVGYSGMGRYSGKFGFDTFTHEKSVMMRDMAGEHVQEPRYPPHDH
uniref:Aldehyde dehydrogenase n=1 Tax=Caenorhabditis japonica TaxID=281687 RepID=A0A8R1E203_CAEJA